MLGFGVILSQETVTTVFYLNYDLVPFGVAETSTSFVVVYRQLTTVLRHRMSNMLQPVTGPVCSLMVLASTQLAAVFAFSVFAKWEEWSMKRFLRIFRKVWVSLNSLLVDQSATDIKTQNLSHMVPWLLWSSLALTVSQIYRGELFSILSQPEPLNLPRNLKALVDTKMTVFCLDAFYKVQGNFGVTQGSFIVDLVRTLKPTRGEEEKALLDLLLGNIHSSSNLSFAEFLGSYWKRSRIPGDNDSGSKVIPNQFVFMGREVSTRRMKNLLTEFTKSWISEIIPALDYHERMTPAFSKNYVNHLFRTGMAGFTESGIQGLWQNYGDWIDYGFTHFDAFRSLKNLNKTWFSFRERLAAILNRDRFELHDFNCWTEKCGSHTEKIRDTFSKIPREVFDVVFRYWGICVGAVVLVLAWETRMRLKTFLVSKVYLKTVSKWKSWRLSKKQIRVKRITVQSSHQTC